MAPAFSLLPHILLAFHLFFAFFLSLSDSHHADDELQILLRLKSTFPESNSQVFTSWVPTNSLCNFTGITCTQLGEVTEIELSNRRLSGSPPLNSICQLQHLQKLSLGANNLSGRIPEGLNNCRKLKYLDLGNNDFEGSFPDIPSLGELRFLYLNNTGISGTFPWSSLNNMTNLLQLSLGDNPFDKAAFPDQVLKLYQLEWLYLSNCSLQGKVPTGLGNLTRLRNLEIARNFLTGEIPPDTGKLRNLWQFELYDNYFSGKLPAGIGNLTALQFFDASMNNLQGEISQVRTMTDLVSLQLYLNEFSGQVPQELGVFKRLVNLSLYGNRLTGHLPPSLGSWTTFNFIDASENFLTGPIPPDMCKHGTMRKLLILQNRLTGEIPATYANCTSLVRFRVNNNSLTGSVPRGIWSLPSATIIDIRFNQLEGSIGKEIQKAKSLSQLYAGNNNLSGELPIEISRLSSMVVMQLNDNHFTGVIPDSIGDLFHLGSLYLQNNNISGSLPESLGYCRYLAEINIANNLLSGQIPPSFGSLSNLNALNLSGNKLTGRIPPSLSSLGLSVLDLSNNNLIGRIPPSLSIQAYNGSFDGNDELCSEIFYYFRRCSKEASISKNYRVMIGILAALVVTLILLAACFSLAKTSAKNKDRVLLKKGRWNLKSFQILKVTEDEILDQIKHENLIGKGGSGDVYRISLADGKHLAVKHICNSSLTGRKLCRSSSPMLAKQKATSREFDAEVEILSSIRHVNIVKLYCSITSDESSLLVYEYMRNGSLWDRLHTPNKMQLDWECRHDIALGSAKGLEYLHHGCERPIIHRDVKSSNILLDEFLKPRIADFGLAKIIDAHRGPDSNLIIAGTPGYFAPEYVYTQNVTEKSDVYSFGVVLMEIVTGKRPVEVEYGEDIDIVGWVCRKLRNKESLTSIIDSSVVHMKEEAFKVMKVAASCTTRVPEHRPSMRMVVKMLIEVGPYNMFRTTMPKNCDSCK